MTLKEARFYGIVREKDAFVAAHFDFASGSL
jgi:hypothetical protein